MMPDPGNDVAQKCFLVASLMIHAATSDDATRKAQAWANAIATPDAKQGILAVSLHLTHTPLDQSPPPHQTGHYVLSLTGEVFREVTGDSLMDWRRWLTKIRLLAGRMGVQVSEIC